MKTLILWQKFVLNLFIFVYLFFLKNSTTGSKKTVITRQRLVVKSCPLPCWITFLTFYRLMCNIPSHISDLILVWSAYLKQTVKVFSESLFDLDDFSSYTNHTNYINYTIFVSYTVFAIQLVKHLHMLTKNKVWWHRDSWLLCCLCRCMTFFIKFWN